MQPTIQKIYSVFQKMSFDKENGVMVIGTTNSIAIGDEITLHDKSVVRIVDVIESRKAKGIFEKDSSRPNIYTAKVDVLYTHKWSYSQKLGKKK